MFRLQLYRFHWRYLLLTIVAAVSLIALVVHRMNLTPPQLHIVESNFSLGRVFIPEHGLNFKFQLENWGGRELLIKGLHASCGCTTTTLTADRIAPGGEIQLIAVVRPEQAGQQNISVTLFTNDPASPTQVVTADWDGHTGIEVTPNEVNIGGVKAGSMIKQTVSTMCAPGTRVTGVTSAEQRIQAELSGTNVMLSVNAGNVRGKHSGAIHLSTTGTATKEILIPVSWEVQSDLEVVPASVYLAPVAFGKHQSAAIRIKSRSDESLQPTWDWVDVLSGTAVEVNACHEGGWKLEVTRTPDLVPGLTRGKLRIILGDEEVVIPVTAVSIGNRSKP